MAVLLVDEDARRAEAITKGVRTIRPVSMLRIVSLHEVEKVVRDGPYIFDTILVVVDQFSGLVAFMKWSKELHDLRGAKVVTVVTRLVHSLVLRGLGHRHALVRAQTTRDLKGLSRLIVDRD